jgi:hypothetical protein
MNDGADLVIACARGMANIVGAQRAVPFYKSFFDVVYVGAIHELPLQDHGKIKMS